MEALLAIIQKVDNIAILVLVGMVAGLSYLHIVWRREEREDRAKLLDLLRQNTDALNAIKNVLSALSGKVIT